jgi:hypothetical protein
VAATKNPRHQPPDFFCYACYLTSLHRLTSFRIATVWLTRKDLPIRATFL